MQNYKEYFFIPAAPELVYKALTTASTIALWTGEEAVMVAEPDMEFSLWSGAIVGKNLLFEANKRIEQHWYFGDEPEKSIVSIKLHEQKSGTSMEVRQSNIPDEAFEDIVDGWRHTYIASLIDFYQE
ncbi:Activator of Hsp90 ATPase homolog 1-like protein [bacterium A37T11]|nr:Activator of Hsp90 ATPase homolog 1-like protein [bacterium A37T11]